MSQGIPPQVRKGCLGCLGLFGALLIAAWVWGSLNPTDPDASAKKVGSQAHLYIRADRVVEEGQMVVLAADESAFDEMVKSSVAGDVRGISLLVMGRRAFMVPQGTSVLVIDTGMFRRRVRVLEGEAAGMAGWVPSEMLLE